MGVMLFLLGAVAIESIEGHQEKIAGAYSDLFFAYINARDDLPPLPLPMGAEDVLSRMEAHDWSFLNDHWFVNQPGSFLYVPADSMLAKQLKLPLQILALEDISRGEITIYCEDKKGTWTGLALFPAPPILDETAPFYARLQGTTGEDGVLIVLPGGEYRHLPESVLNLNAYGAYGN